MIFGYKSFDENYKNIAGMKMVEGKTYHTDGKIKYGIKGNGYHFAKNLEDTLRFQLKNDRNLVNPIIAKVIGSGKIIEADDDYYGYYDLYVAENIMVEKFLTRDEVLEYALKLPDKRMERFVSLFRLTDDEIKLFKGKYINVDKAILYYQKGILDVYKLDTLCDDYCKRLKKY